MLTHLVHPTPSHPHTLYTPYHLTHLTTSHLHTPYHIMHLTPPYIPTPTPSYTPSSHPLHPHPHILHTLHPHMLHTHISSSCTLTPSHHHTSYLTLTPGPCREYTVGSNMMNCRTEEQWRMVGGKQCALRGNTTTTLTQTLVCRLAPC